MHTRAQALAAARASVGITGKPNFAWPVSTGNYCMASVALWAGYRTRSDLGIDLISIEHFRSSHNVPLHPLSAAEPGDFILLEWEADGRSAADHIGMFEKFGPVHGSAITIEGNTGPRPGVAEPNGFYRRIRYAPNIIGVLKPAYASAPAPKPKPTPVAKGVFYVVRSGDTLTSIARKYKTTVQKIVALNSKTITNANKISVGLKVRVK